MSSHPNSARFLSERVLSLKQFVGNDGRRRADFVFGLSALDIYGELYQKELKFASRKKRKIAMFTDDDAYCEAVFGDFSHSKSLDYVKKAYVDICEPDLFSATAANCLRLLKEGYFTPLHATHHELDATFENRDDPTIFVFDPQKTVDLIDYWNLRQFRSNVFPVNVHWFDEFADTIRKLVVSNFRPLPGNRNGVMIRTTIEFARSIDPTQRDALLRAHMQNISAGSFACKHL